MSELTPAEQLLHNIFGQGDTEMTTATTTMTDARKAFLHYLFTTALEGGIGYWSQCETYHWHKGKAAHEPNVSSCDNDDIDGFYAVLVPAEDEWGVEAAYQPDAKLPIHPSWEPSTLVRAIRDLTPLRVDLKVMERGCNLLVDKVIEATKDERTEGDFSRKYLRQFVIQWLTDAEDGDSDSDVADLVVQLGLFGEVVYA